jgi:hypothetical protein
MKESWQKKSRNVCFWSNASTVLANQEPREGSNVTAAGYSFILSTSELLVMLLIFSLSMQTI